MTIFYISRYTKKGSDKTEKIVYAIVLNWPQEGKLQIGAPQLTDSSSITMLGYSHDLKVSNSFFPKLET